MKKYTLLILLISLFFIGISPVKANVCDNSTYSCITCEYDYQSEIVSTNTIYFVVSADGQGSASIIKTELPAVNRNYGSVDEMRIVNNINLPKYFIKDGKSLYCPPISSSYSVNFSDPSKEHGIGELKLYVDEKKESPSVMDAIKVTTNGKDFMAKEGETISGNTSKSCMFAQIDSNKKVVYSFILNYNASSNKYSISDASDMALMNIDSGLTSIFQGKKCDDIAIYVRKEEASEFSSTKYDLNISLSSKTGYTRMVGMNPTNDAEEISKNVYDWDIKDVNYSDITSCNKLIPIRTQKVLQNILKYIQYSGPILVIIFSIIDLAKAAASGEADDMKKVYQKFIKRVIAAILLFFLFPIINIIFEYLGITAPRDCLK